MINSENYKIIHNKLDFLLQDHKVDFDESHLESESLSTLHAKADALLVAHKCAIPETNIDIIGLQPKLDMLIAGHGKEFDDSAMDLNSVDTILAKLNELEQAHGH